MKVLIGCERSGIIRNAFRARGHAAFSVDLEASEDESPFHFVGNVFKVLGSSEFSLPYDSYGKRMWDLFIVHPECRYLCGSGLHWNARRPERRALTSEAEDFALACWYEGQKHARRVCLENPVGILSRSLGKPTQTVQPYEFGDDASKRTCFWLWNLPQLARDPAPRCAGRWVKRPDGRMVERWGNQTDSGQNRLGPSETRSMDRARTYPGIARAMAAQWG